MNHRLIVLALVMAIGIFQIANCRLESGICSLESEILVIDLSKTLPANPYQEEYEQMLYPTVRITAGNSTGSGVIINHRGSASRCPAGIRDAPLVSIGAEPPVCVVFAERHGAVAPKGTKDTKNTIYILSAAHVVDNFSEVDVEIYRSLTETLRLSASVVLTDTIKDLALLSVLCDSVAKARLAPADYQPYIFTPVYSVGCSLGLTPRPSQGIITVIHPSPFPLLPPRRDEGGYWEISAPILPGNSGGPVYDARTYEVIGIAVWIHTYNGQLITTMAGIVPVQDIYTFLEQVKD
jgi:hypothetical protein